MSTYSGRPVLADLDPVQVPVTPPEVARYLLRGMSEGWAKTLVLSAHHDEATEHEYDLAVIEAREHPSYPYSRGFLAGATAATEALRSALAEFVPAPAIGGTS